MTPELLHELSEYPTFPESAKVLIEVIGREAAARLVAAWGGAGVAGSYTPWRV